MRLSIRLQQHGKKNHPYWWIVVAPQNKNIFGRFTDHIGFWSPRHNVNIKRQIIFDVQKAKYWLKNGAIPTPKIYQFLSMYGILPPKWKYIKTEKQKAQIQAKKKPYEQMTQKQKALYDRKKKKKQRLELSPLDYHRYEASAMKPSKLYQRIIAKQHAQQFQNQVLRNILHEVDFQRYDRIVQLSNNSQNAKPWSLQIKNIKDKIKKQKSQLAFLEKQHMYSKYALKTKIVQKITILQKQLNQLQNIQSRIDCPQIPNSSDPITTSSLQSKLKYQLITKRIQKNQKDLQKLQTFHEPITLDQFYQQFKQFINNKKLNNNNQQFDDYNQDVLYQYCQEQFQSCVEQGNPLTKFHLFMLTEEGQAFASMYDNQKQYSQQIYKSAPKSAYNNLNTFIESALNQQSQLPSFHPVHPRPDLKTFIPQQHYDPITSNNLQIMVMDSLQPYQEIQKYKKKRKDGQSCQVAKQQEQRLRMQRLQLYQKNQK